MTTDPTHLPVGPPLAPPPRSTAFDDYATTGDDQDAGDGAPRAASPLVLAVLGILLGLAAGIVTLCGLGLYFSSVSERRRELIRDVPLAISSVPAERLQEVGAKTLNDYLEAARCLVG